MAEDYNKLKKAYDDLYITLYDDSKGYSLATKMSDARKKYGETSDKYLSFKRQWDAYKLEYDDLKKRIDAIDASKKEEKKEYNYTNPKGNKVKQITDLDEQAAAAKEQGDVQAYTDAVNKANALRQEVAAAGYTPPAIPPAIATPPAGAPAPVSPVPSAKPTPGTPDASGNIPVVTDKYSAYTINADGTVTNSVGPVLFVEEKDAKGNIVSTPYTESAKARAAFLKQYATPQAIKQLQADMLASNYITQADIASGQWAVKGLNDLLSAYTFKSVSDVKYGLTTQPMGLTSFLKLKKSSSGSGETTSFKTITTRGDAKRLLNEYFTDLVGGPATDEEEDAFYKELNSRENKAVRTYRDGVTTGSELDETERLLIAANVARKRLRNSDVDELLASSKGSQVAIDISNLQKTAAAYGVSLTAADALKQVASGLGQKDYVAKQQERLRLIGKQLYPNLAPHIDAGGTVADIADQYAYTKVKKLGVAVPISTMDKDIMDAINGGMSIADFNVALQKKDEWRYTEEADAVANDFLGTMLKTFGLA